MSKRSVLTSHSFLLRSRGGGATPLLAFVLFSSWKFFAADVAVGVPTRPPSPCRGRVAGSPEDRALLIGCETFQPDPGWGSFIPVTTDPPDPRIPARRSARVQFLRAPGDRCRHSNGVSRRGTPRPTAAPVSVAPRLPRGAGRLLHPPGWEEWARHPPSSPTGVGPAPRSCVNRGTRPSVMDTAPLTVFCSPTP